MRRFDRPTPILVRQYTRLRTGDAPGTSCVTAQNCDGACEDFCVFNARVCKTDVTRPSAAPATGSQVGRERVAAAADGLVTSPWHTRARKSVNPIPVLSVDERFWDFCVQCATNCAGIERHCVRGPREGAFNTSSSTSGAQIHHSTFTARERWRRRILPGRRRPRVCAAARAARNAIGIEDATAGSSFGARERPNTATPARARSPLLRAKQAYPAKLAHAE